MIGTETTTTGDTTTMPTITIRTTTITTTATTPTTTTTDHAADDGLEYVTIADAVQLGGRLIVHAAPDAAENIAPLCDATPMGFWQETETSTGRDVVFCPTCEAIVTAYDARPSTPPAATTTPTCFYDSHDGPHMADFRIAFTRRLRDGRDVPVPEFETIDVCLAELPHVVADNADVLERTGVTMTVRVVRG